MNDHDLPVERRCREALIALRKCLRSVEIHSHILQSRFGLTGSQLLVLEEVGSAGPVSMGHLAQSLSVSMATVTGITARLEARGLVERRRGDQDRRQVVVEITESARDLLQLAPSAVPDQFLTGFGALKSWEQHQLLSSIQRMAAIMNREDELDRTIPEARQA